MFIDLNITFYKIKNLKKDKKFFRINFRKLVIFFLLGMWMTRNRFEDAAKSIFALCPDITALNKDGNFAIEVKTFFSH